MIAIVLLPFRDLYEIFNHETALASGDGGERI
jgi:hypothetical protein